VDASPLEPVEVMSSEIQGVVSEGVVTSGHAMQGARSGAPSQALVGDAVSRGILDSEGLEASKGLDVPGEFASVLA
jgi:hypothetical protein